MALTKKENTTQLLLERFSFIKINTEQRLNIRHDVKH